MKAIRNMLRRIRNYRAIKRDEKQLMEIWAIAEDPSHPSHERILERMEEEREMEEEYSLFQQGLL